MMAVMLMGRVSKHGGRRVLVTVMVMMVSSSNHGVTVNVLLVASTGNVVGLMMRMATDRATRVETQQFLNGEWRTLWQR